MFTYCFCQGAQGFCSVVTVYLFTLLYLFLSRHMGMQPDAVVVGFISLSGSFMPLWEELIMAEDVPRLTAQCIKPSKYESVK